MMSQTLASNDASDDQEMVMILDQDPKQEENPDKDSDQEEKLIPDNEEKTLPKNPIIAPESLPDDNKPKD